MLTAITFPLILRRLGVEMYGIWSYVIALMGFLDLLANPGLSNHAGQQVAARRMKAADVVSDSTVLRGLLGVLVVGVIFTVAAFEPKVEAARLLRFYGVSITLINLTSSEYLLSSLELFHGRSVLMVTQQALYTLGIVLMVRSPRDYMWVPASILLSALPTNLAGWIFLRRRGLHIRLGLHTERWWALMVPSGHYALATTMSTVYHRTGHLLVRWFLGEHALGLYAAATRLVDFVRNLVSIGFTIITPRVAQSGDSPPALQRLARFSVAGIALVGLPLTVGILTTAQVLVPVALGAQYAESARLLPWLAAYVVVAPLAAFFSGTVLYALGRHREYLISTASGAAVAVIAYLMLVPLGGIRGASVAFVLGEAVVAVVAYRLAPEAARDVWNSGLLKVAVAGAGVMVMALFAARLLRVPILTAAMASGVVYVTFCGWQSRRRIQAEIQRGD
jgi:O-antigen/teichoic acid export membrane protein